MMLDGVWRYYFLILRQFFSQWEGRAGTDAVGSFLLFSLGREELVLGGDGLDDAGNVLRLL